jgi:hypothetical protein
MPKSRVCFGGLLILLGGANILFVGTRLTDLLNDQDFKA